jgi:hypothetical protein
MENGSGMKLKGAYYPELLKMADFQTQIDVGCDPDVLRFFSDPFIQRERREDLQIMIFEADESIWTKTQSIWTQDLKENRAFSPDFH